eukprot:scaffold13271_cov31-Prasinocladus_malaysianus.AAC.3
MLLFSVLRDVRNAAARWRDPATPRSRSAWQWAPTARDEAVRDEKLGILGLKLVPHKATEGFVVSHPGQVAHRLALAEPFADAFLQLHMNGLNQDKGWPAGRYASGRAGHWHRKGLVRIIII